MGKVMIADISEWRTELIDLGDIIQEDDTSVSAEVAKERFNRYTQLVGMVEGTEGVLVVEALIASMRALNDYGAYQSTHGALALFPVADLVKGAALAIPALVKFPVTIAVRYSQPSRRPMM
jgi:hypothetical protein